MSITIKWGRERFTLDLPPSDAPLAIVRKLLADYTQIPDNAFKLIHSGALMKDDSAPISAYGLHNNSTIVLIGSSDPQQARAAQPSSRSERSIIAKIQAEISSVRNILKPGLDSFLLDPTNKKEHTRLGELLLQSLLRLDGVTADPEWEDARRERKEAVREVQNMLDRLDDAWASRTTTVTA